MRGTFTLLLAVFAFFLVAPAFADEADHVGVGPAPLEEMTMSSVIGRQEFSRMRKLVDPRAGQISQPEANNQWAVLWYCVAQSAVTGNWYYWYSYDAYYARNQALAACISDNGYTCNVGCRVSY